MPAAFRHSRSSPWRPWWSPGSWSLLPGVVGVWSRRRASKEPLMHILSMARPFALALALVMSLPGWAATAAPSGADADVAASIDGYMRGRMPTLRTPGVSLVVVEGDQVTFSRGYGFADREAGTP